MAFWWAEGGAIAASVAATAATPAAASATHPPPFVLEAVAPADADLARHAVARGRGTKHPS